MRPPKFHFANKRNRKNAGVKKGVHAEKTVTKEREPRPRFINRVTAAFIAVLSPQNRISEMSVRGAR